MHPLLTTRQELEYAGELRLPPDLGQEGVLQRVNQVMSELGLTPCADLQVAKLSGGQRKRVSVGVELLTQPALLFLDEPTSGLDPGNEHQVMSVLRQLADGGRIVVVVTHATQSLDLVDRVLFLSRGGKMAFFGPPTAALDYFTRHGVSGGYAEIFRVLENPGEVDWAAEFRADPDFDRYVSVAIRQAQVASRVASAPATPLASPVGPFLQFRILVRRQLRILSADRRALTLFAVQAPVFGLLIALLIHSPALNTKAGPLAGMLLWLLVISATWLGASNSVREIVKELPIYQRERGVGLSISAYIGSKAGVFGAITAIQAVILTFIGLSFQNIPVQDPLRIIGFLQHPETYQNVPLNVNPLAGLRPFDSGSLLPSQLVEILIAVVLSGLAGMALGLAISARVRRSDQAILLLPVVLVVQTALSLPLIQSVSRTPVLKVLADLTSANWGVAAVASTTSLNQLQYAYFADLSTGGVVIGNHLNTFDPGFRGVGPNFLPGQLQMWAVGDPAWRHTPEAWLFAVGLLIGFTALFLGFAWYSLRRLDIGRSSGRAGAPHIE